MFSNNNEDIITYTVPFLLEEIKETVIDNDNPITKEEIIEKGIKYHLQGNILEATKYYKYCIKQGFNDQRIFSNYGVILKNLGELNTAELSLRKAIELNPHFADAHKNLGMILKDLGKLKEAESSTRQSIKLNPDNANAYSNLGIILQDLGKLKEAESATRNAIELNPDSVVANYNLGIILQDLGKLKEAEIATRKAIELNPNLAEAHCSLGSILIDIGNLEKASLSIHKAIELKPDFPDANFKLSLIDLRQGNYKSGLENYEFRFKTKNPVNIHAKTKIKRYEKNKLQKGEKLLVVTEQGLGDTLQYMRYIPYIRSKGLDVSFCAQTKLHSLIQSSGIDQNPLTPQQSTLISEGEWISLLSLPKYLQINPNKPIISEAYIFSTYELINKWKKILSNEKRLLVGINWQGNKRMEKNYKGRSIPLEAFSRLFEHNEITLLSLQKGFGSEQLEKCSFKNKFVECQSQIDSIWDFLENAAIIENCDLIITCDTSIAHLAGGMGKKVWLLLKDPSYWTWGLESESTFWYPSMRLFRQKSCGDWNEVMERVSNTIKVEMNTNL